MYTTIETEQHYHIATIWLNRPEVRNALNDTMTTELIQAFKTLSTDPAVRVITLRGKGKVFCAGADLKWMKATAAYSYEENLEESAQLARCFQTVYHTSKPTIAVVHGAAMGGANGLIAACDFAYAADDTLFAFSEVRLGLVPATIAPYILKRIGESKAKELILTGRPFHAKEAAEAGLINQVLQAMELESKVAELIQELLQAGPGSIAASKQLLHHLSAKELEAAIPDTVEAIAKARSSAEGQEGMQAFFEKRKPNWRL
ncbi:enoyl-CoA hydratase/isomerase family protein [Niabella sp. CC-SYL272]|uniref:enoyl-CoA hydratase/isomerase family protein n=1 Tax=Niabella agricola TaxID=2891571 RepID=UPI001F395860|nr:enoyl-CoA hydratase/isomerase family protein [Niabella agricola]MCF3111690.1 enoyl-CoA hydratase/isomerase family protein [Niabella agricola]